MVSSTSGRWTKSQTMESWDNVTEALGSLNSHSALYSFCFPPEFKLKHLISQFHKPKTCSTIYQNNVGGRRAQNWNVPSIGSKTLLNTLSKSPDHRALGWPTKTSGIRFLSQSLLALTCVSLIIFNLNYISACLLSAFPTCSNIKLFSILPQKLTGILISVPCTKSYDF